MNQNAIVALQHLLIAAGHDAGPVDGVYGPITARSVETYLGGGSLSCKQQIIDRAFDLCLTNQETAYILATVEHETAGTFQPKVENFNYLDPNHVIEKWPFYFKTKKQVEPYVRNPCALASFIYNGQNGNTLNSNDGWVYRSRGLIPIIGKNFYKKMGTMVYEDLIEDPDLILEPSVAVECVLIGCLEGVYTGYKLRQFINSEQCDYVNARSVVGSATRSDRSNHIAGLADLYERSLAQGGFNC